MLTTFGVFVCHAVADADVEELLSRDVARKLGDINQRYGRMHHWKRFV